MAPAITISLDDAASVRAAATALTFRTDAFIDGRFVAARSGKRFATENPATGKKLADVAECDSADVDVAVAAARRTFDAGVWSRAPPAERREVLCRFAALVDEHRAELALLDCLEAGKPIQDCYNVDVPETALTFRWHAQAIDKLYDAVAPTAADALALVVREPIGVVACCSVWNFSALMAAWKVAPALATGCSVVLKPSEFTSFAALRLAELAHEAGVPAGVFSVVPGFGPTVGAALGRHADVDAVAFTGSTTTGRQFLKYAAESNLKRVTLECGGKSPQLVFDDADDLDSVAEHAMNAAYWNMGENCSCGSRLLVHESRREELVAKLVALTKQWPVGDPLDPKTRVGSLIHKAHMDKVLSYIDAGKAEGARLACGGERVCEESGGYYVGLTIFDGVSNDAKIAREEIFGPVLSVISFSSEDEAVRLANDTPYGLAASLYTANVHRAHRVARALRAGTVSVNCFGEGDITTPFGGYKMSGFAGRDKGIWAHESYTLLKTIWLSINPNPAAEKKKE